VADLWLAALKHPGAREPILQEGVENGWDDLAIRNLQMKQLFLASGI